MKLVFYSIVLNHHQAFLSDELYKLLGNEYCFVELGCQKESKGATEDFSTRPYLLSAVENHKQAINLARTAECCVFSGVQSLPYMKERLKLGLLSFDMGERWLKKGIKNIFSPAISKMLLSYYIYGWKHQPLYKLCMSSFTASDHAKLKMYKDKCYKWGYFTSSDIPKEIISGRSEHQKMEICPNNTSPVRLMWCARFLKLKHPELPVLLVARLKADGYNILLDYYGAGSELEQTKEKVDRLKLWDYIRFRGEMPNIDILEAMRDHDIFLFTSNRLEGWGVVVNEAMSNGCAVVSSSDVGSASYLIEDGVTGYKFRSGNLDAFYEKVKKLIEHPDVRRQIQLNAQKQMQHLWSPSNAAKALLVLINDLQNGKCTSIIDGPCSKA